MVQEGQYLERFLSMKSFSLYDGTRRIEGIFRVNQAYIASSAQAEAYRTEPILF